ncbi:MAG TPA: GNAT family N-acetyltransferase [Gaiellaceae bacterium]
MPGARDGSRSALTSRAYVGADDLDALHAVVRAVWAVDKSHASLHVGDVTWGMYQHEPELARPRRAEIFERDGEPVAFGILWLPQTLQSTVHPEHRDDAVYDALLEWFAAAAGAELDGGLDAELLESDVVFATALERHGYAPLGNDDWLEHRVRSLAEPIEPSPLPGGYRLRNVEGEADVERRVAVHRAAFHPSKVTVSAYRRLRALPPYREQLDLVVEAPGGSFAAYALVWLDEENGVGELEPVGTHPKHQRLGLGKAVCVEACRRLREAGADTAIVYSVHGYHAGKLYESAGFEVVDRHLQYRLATQEF